MNQKGYTLIEMLIVIVIIAIIATLVFNNYKTHKEERIMEFQEIFGIDLTPHLEGPGIKIINPEAKEIIQPEVTKVITQLQKQYYESWLERQKVKEMSPDEFGSAIRQLERFRELNRKVANNWGPYIRARRAAEWWFFDIDLPEMLPESPDQ